MLHSGETINRLLHRHDRETHASAFYPLEENNPHRHNDRKTPIHQNEQRCNFFAHQAPLARRMGDFITDGTFVSRLELWPCNIKLLELMCNIIQPLYMSSNRLKASAGCWDPWTGGKYECDVIGKTVRKYQTLFTNKYINKVTAYTLKWFHVENCLVGVKYI